MIVYFISGLAADRRVFRNISLPEGYEARYLDWIDPVRKETLEEYSLRLAAGIDRSVPFGLIGMSMGGMIAAEIAKKYPADFIVLISSIASASHFPALYRFLGRAGVHRLIPASFLKSASVLKRLFEPGTMTDKKLLTQIILDSDPVFIRWALAAVLTWRSTDPPENYLHIHGTRDSILPLRLVRPTHVIKNGGHMMVLNRASEINEILRQHLLPPIVVSSST